MRERERQRERYESERNKERHAIERGDEKKKSGESVKERG